MFKCYKDGSEQLYCIENMSYISIKPAKCHLSSTIIGWVSLFSCHLLYHNQDTFHAGKGSAEMCSFRMAALMFLKDHGIKQD